jgi:uncharacterized protein
MVGVIDIHSTEPLGLMNPPGSNLPELLRSMEPVLNEGVYVFASVPFTFNASSLEPIATVREQEGLTVIVEEGRARAAKLKVLCRAVWITLKVHSDLEAVGLTAAFASVTSQANISCNVIAGAFHDHIFVPVDSGEKALTALHELQLRS